MSDSDDLNERTAGKATLHELEVLGEAEPSEEELAEARELVRLMEGGSDQGELPRAFETAALLRVVARPDLDEGRAQDLARELSRAAGAAKRAPEARHSSSWFEAVSLRWLWALVPAALVPVALIVAVVWEPLGEAPRPSAVASLPSPPVELLRAQAAVLKGEVNPEYDRHMAAYRGTVLAALRAP